jgi:hypothetical protein
MAIPLTQAIGILNAMVDAAATLYTELETIQQLNSQWLNETLATEVAAMATCASLPDGSLGAADGTPNTAHLIDTRVYSTLKRALSEADYAALNTFFSAFINLMAGAAVTQQGQAPGLFARLAGS